MATKAAAKRGKVAVETAVITITPEQFKAGLERFGRICDYVEREAHNRGAGIGTAAAAPAPRLDISSNPPSQPDGAEQKARFVAEYSAKVYAMAAEVRGRVLYGGGTPNEGCGKQVVPSEGPIKDALNETMANMDRVTSCLDDILRYIGQ